MPKYNKLYMAKATETEELLYAMRIYTAGYKIFTCPINLLFHFYLRNNSPKIWNEKNFYEENKKTLRAVKRMLLLETEEEKKDDTPVKKIDHPIEKKDVEAYYKMFNFDIKNDIYEKKRERTESIY